MTFTSRRVALPTGISLHVREQGEGGPTTLLLHGWAVSGVVWEPVLASWPAHAGRVIAPDLRGTGFSQKPREGYTLEDDVRDVVALIDTLGLTDVVLVGHSKGGAIAQRVALERPAALRKLVLVCAVPASGIPFPDADAAFFDHGLQHLGTILEDKGVELDDGGLVDCGQGPCDAEAFEVPGTGIVDPGY